MTIPLGRRSALDAGAPDALALGKRAVAVRDTRATGKSAMIHNAARPRIEVDPETYDVRADGELLVCEPATSVPMAQRYFLF